MHQPVRRFGGFYSLYGGNYKFFFAKPSTEGDIDFPGSLIDPFIDSPNKMRRNVSDDTGRQLCKDWSSINEIIPEASCTMQFFCNMYLIYRQRYIK